MFGTTLEYMLKNFTSDFENIEGYIGEDGSMHTFLKEFHANNLNDFQNFNDTIKVSTIIYPFADAKLDQVLRHWPGNLITAKNIFIKSNNLYNAELNLLFQYYKVMKGIVNWGYSIFGEDGSKNLRKWNKNYNYWSQLHDWEFREWLSLYYPEWITEWINIEKSIQLIPNSIIINNIDILYDLDSQFTNISAHCNLSIEKSNKYFSFISAWKKAQQYILDEFKLIDKIVTTTISKKNFDWQENRLCIFAESIIQKRLRDNGYEIKCYNLNDFPTNSEQLYNLLEKQ